MSSSLNAFAWLEKHPGSVSVTKTERGRFQVKIPDPVGENPVGILFERSTLLGALYKAMEFEDRIRLMARADASELSVATQRNEDREALAAGAKSAVEGAFGVKVKSVDVGQ